DRLRKDAGTARIAQRRLRRVGGGAAAGLSSAFENAALAGIGLVRRQSGMGAAAPALLDGVVARWFETCNCQTAVIRPDHYVYSVAEDCVTRRTDPQPGAAEIARMKRSWSSTVRLRCRRASWRHR